MLADDGGAGVGVERAPEAAEVTRCERCTGGKNGLVAGHSQHDFGTIWTDTQGHHVLIAAQSKDGLPLLRKAWGNEGGQSERARRDRRRRRNPIGADIVALNARWHLNGKHIR